MQKKNKIKILFIIDFIRSLNAGTENQLSKIINKLNKNSFEIHLYCLVGSEWIRTNANAKLNCCTSVKSIFKFKSPITYLNIIKMIFSIKRLDPDIVHTFFPISNVVGVIAAHFAGVKCIISSRRDYGQWISPLSLFFTKIANKFVFNIHTNSYKIKKNVSIIEGIKTRKINVIYNGIDIVEFRNKIDSNKIDIRKKLGIPLKNKIVGSVANFRPMKCLDTLILAASEVLKKQNNISFVLVGNGPSRQKLEEMVLELGLGGNIFFAGSHENIIPYISIFDIGVNCSSKEGLSNAIIEYMLAGVPCIVSEAGGNTELIEHGWNGYTFPLNNYKILANLILELIGDNENKIYYIKNSKDKIIKNLSLNKMIFKFEKYYFSQLKKLDKKCV